MRKDGQTDIQRDRLSEDYKRKSSVKFALEQAMKTQRRDV
jgi:hypothetical protein